MKNCTVCRQEKDYNLFVVHYTDACALKGEGMPLNTDHTMLIFASLIFASAGPWGHGLLSGHQQIISFHFNTRGTQNAEYVMKVFMLGDYILKKMEWLGDSSSIFRRRGTSSFALEGATLLEL